MVSYDWLVVDGDALKALNRTGMADKNETQRWNSTRTENDTLRYNCAVTSRNCALTPDRLI